jgi:cysteine synthase B
MRPNPQLAVVSRHHGSTVLDCIGNTPLLRLDRVSADSTRVQVLAKAEWQNPGGSVKDRAAAAIVCEALQSGKLARGKILLDSTSGNTGIA